MAVLLTVGLATIALGYLLGLVPVILGLFVLGFANGAWDVAMTLGRWFGPALLDRHGRVAVIRVLSALGIAGTLLFVLAPVTPRRAGSASSPRSSRLRGRSH